jgi:siroheme synthase-like protein
MKAPPSEDSKRKTFAANLLLEGHRCLVVGGGKIATRKLKILLDAGALPEVVAPELAPAMKELCEKSGAVVRLREFEDSDLDGAFLVFAATGSAELNARVAALCAKGGRLCCAIDAHWTEGSFITPASFELEGVKIAVSTGGASCRRSKAIKESLALQLKVMEGAEPFVLGVDHSTLPLEARAKFQLDAKAQDRLAFLFGGVRGMREFMILNTCNRLETIGVAFLREPGAEMMKLALGFDALPEGSVYLKRGHDAFAHLAALAAGLRSQSIGEKHIVSQLKDALKLARRKGWGSAFIQELLDYALHISKDIRAELGSLLEGGEIEDFAIELARRKAQEGTKALVLGTGALGKAVAAKLVAKGFQTAALYHSKKPDSPACPCEKIDAPRVFSRRPDWSSPPAPARSRS